MEHPIRTAAPGTRRPPGVVVDNYALEGRRDTTWHVDGVVKYHRRISTILNALLDTGLHLERLDEPTPNPEAVAGRMDLVQHLASSPVLVIAARQPGMSPPASRSPTSRLGALEP